MKPKKPNKPKGLSRKPGKKKLSTQEAIAMAMAPKQPKPLKEQIRIAKEEIEPTGNANQIENVTKEEQLSDIPSLVDYYDKEEMAAAKDFEGEMTPKELMFLGLWLSGNISKIKAMKSAGFVAANDTYLYLLAKKILQKYESQVKDHRIIFRAMGAGETFVAKGLIDLAKSAKSDMVKLNAYAQIAKILGLTKEQLEGGGGVTIIFEGPGTTASPPGAPPPPAPPAPPATLPSQAALPSPASVKPIMITR